MIIKKYKSLIVIFCILIVFSIQTIKAEELNEVVQIDFPEDMTVAYADAVGVLCNGMELTVHYKDSDHTEKVVVKYNYAYDSCGNEIFLKVSRGNLDVALVYSGDFFDAYYADLEVDDSETSNIYNYD